MIAADANVWIDYFNQASSKEAGALDQALEDGTLMMPVHVLTELISSPNILQSAVDLLKLLPRLELDSEFWARAGELRRKVLKKKLKARTLDCLIAQSCLDHGVPLITRDLDYRHFKEYGL